jgi:uracil-DNA glycosylase
MSSVKRPVPPDVPEVAILPPAAPQRPRIHLLAVPPGEWPKAPLVESTTVELPPSSSSRVAAGDWVLVHCCPPGKNAAAAFHGTVEGESKTNLVVVRIDSFVTNPGAHIYGSLRNYVPPEWVKAIGNRVSADFWDQIEQFLLLEDRKGKTIYPPPHQIFRALERCQPAAVKVVVVGQDPYHGPSQAEGLAFAVPHGISSPPSLKNILKELQTDAAQGAAVDLHSWPEQGVLLLNTCLTVLHGKAFSHGIRWRPFTEAVLEVVGEQSRPIVVFAWGKPAQSVVAKVDGLVCSDLVGPRLVVESPHPSPLSASQGFFGSRPFSRANHFLETHKVTPIQWTSSKPSGGKK